MYRYVERARLGNSYMLCDAMFIRHYTRRVNYSRRCSQFAS